MPKFCIYCGSPATTKEHPISQWVSRKLKIELGQTAFTIEALNQERDWVRQVVPFEVPACEPCNSRWLKKMDECEPILSRLIMGEPTRIPVDQQLVLVRWITKACMGLDRHGTRYGRAFAPADLYWFRSRCKPPEGSTIYVGDYQGSLHLGSYWPRVTHVDDTPIAFDVFINLDSPRRRFRGEIYQSTLIINRLVCQIRGYANFGRGVSVNFGVSDPRVAARLWPAPNRDILWPPKAFINDENLPGIIRPPMVRPRGRIRNGEWLNPQRFADNVIESAQKSELAAQPLRRAHPPTPSAGTTEKG